MINLAAITKSIRQASKTENKAEPQDIEPSFFRFICQKRINYRFLWIMLIATLIQFIAFKLSYPYPCFLPESSDFIYAASANLDISIQPIGYSKFLRLFHFITNSDTALITIQYLFLELSCLYFFFTILYFYKPVKTNQIILFIFLFFNPLFLYISNFVSHDAIFLTLSILWFTELLWILQRPKIFHILIQGITLFLCFTVHNHAFIYPIITLIIFALTRLTWWAKSLGITFGLLLIIPFIIHTRNAAFTMTGTKQFSLSTGWQLANNALYMYEYADTSKQLYGLNKELDSLSTKFYNSVPKDFQDEYLLTFPGNFFIQHFNAPLKQFFKRHYETTNDISNISAWGKASVVFKDYARYIIINNKAAFVHEFIIPNTKNYLFPRVEEPEVYKSGLKEIKPLTKSWFHFSSNILKSISPELQKKILTPFIFLFGLLNLYILITLFICWLRDDYKSMDLNGKQFLISSISLLSGSYLLNVSSTIILLRQEIHPMILCFITSLLLTEWASKYTYPKSNQALV